MKTGKTLKFIVSGIAFFLLMLGVLINSSFSYDFGDWNHGAIGYEYAMDEAMEEERPLILYFYQDSCEWCDKMTDRYISPAAAWSFFSDIPKVEINADSGGEEEALCTRYGVKEYPAFFIFIPAFNGKPERIHPFYEKKDMTPDEFLKVIKEKIVYQYNAKGHSFFKDKKYEEALRYYETALGFDPENIYIYFSLGIVYHSMAFNKNDAKLLKKAEENYLKVLDIDPDHKASEKELKKVRKDLKKLGKK